MLVGFGDRGKAWFAVLSAVKTAFVDAVFAFTLSMLTVKNFSMSSWMCSSFIAPFVSDLAILGLFEGPGILRAVCEDSEDLGAVGCLRIRGSRGDGVRLFCP